MSQLMNLEMQIKEAKTIIGQQQMQIQTLQSKEMEFISAMKERDKLITQIQAEQHQLRQEKQHLLDTIQRLKSNAVDAFSEVEQLNKLCIHLKNQHKHREVTEKENLDKVAKFTEKFQFMGNMLQKLDTDFSALKKEHGALIQKFN